MRILLACLVLVATSATAQAPFKKGLPNASCKECGVVTTVRMVRKELRAPENATTENAPSGLVANVPLGSGGGKAKVGSSTRYGTDAASVMETWEVIVKLDDGRYRMATLNDKPELKQGDRVEFDKDGKVQRREN